MYCRNCGAELPEGSAFCPSCGNAVADNMPKNDYVPANAEYQRNDFVPSNDNFQSPDVSQVSYDYGMPSGSYTSQPVQPPRKKSKAPIIVIAVLAALALIFVIVGNLGDSGTGTSSDIDDDIDIAEPSFTLSPVIAPANGTILSGVEGTDSELTVNADSQDCVVKLKDASGNEVLSFYVRAYSSVTVGVPGQYLYTYFASGDTWYGEEYLFGEETSYSMDDEGTDFAEYTSEYSLQPVVNGNFSTTPIDGNEF